jgi:hypothetical protein
MDGGKGEKKRYYRYLKVWISRKEWGMGARIL